MINSIISTLIIAVLSVLNPIFLLLAIPSIFTKLGDAITTVTSSSQWATFLDFVGSVYYFVPKTLVVTLLGFSVVILLIRIGHAIISEIWIG